MKNMSKEENDAPNTPPFAVSGTAAAEIAKPKDAAPESRKYVVLIPKNWKGPRRLVVPGVGLLALDPSNPDQQSKVVTLTEAQAEKLRQNGLSARVSGSEKPGQIKG